MVIIKKDGVQGPTLGTILMVENILKNSDSSVMTIPDIKRNLPRQVNHNVLKKILEYLEESNKIFVSIKGITWIHNTNINLKNSVNSGLKL